MYSTGHRARERLSQPITVNALGVSGAGPKDSWINLQPLLFRLWEGADGLKHWQWSWPFNSFPE